MTDTDKRILDAIQRLEDKVDALDQRINGRVKSLELWRAEVSGAKWMLAAIVSAAISLTVATVGWLITLVTR